jgi:hypothetical protein
LSLGVGFSQNSREEITKFTKSSKNKEFAGSQAWSKTSGPKQTYKPSPFVKFMFFAAIISVFGFCFQTEKSTRGAIPQVDFGFRRSEGSGHGVSATL